MTDSFSDALYFVCPKTSEPKATRDYRPWPSTSLACSEGVGTKIHVALSPERIKGAYLSASNAVDMNEFASLWSQSDWRGIKYVIADKGYDWSKVHNRITAAGKTAVIPRKKGVLYSGVRDKERYKTRSAIERFFGKIKENKRLTLRFDKLHVTFFSFFALACLKVLNLLC